jgi:hypothetical protein
VATAQLLPRAVATCQLLRPLAPLASCHNKGN